MLSRKPGQRLLLVEDEVNVGSTLVEWLKKEGFDVNWARTAAEAGAEMSSKKFDLAILDVGLPDGSGFGVAEKMRKLRSSTAIIFLTAFGAPEARVQGLELGAEDYIVKPFHLKELGIRIQNVLKRASFLDDAKDDIRVGRAVVHFSRYEAVVDNETHSLTQKEMALLKLLVDRRGSVVSRDEILNHVWSEDEFPSSRTIDNFIMRLRRLIEVDPENPQLIRSVRGVGYQLMNEGA